MKSIVLQLLICAFVSQTSSAGKEFQLKPEVPLNIGSYRGNAILSSHTTVHTQQEFFTADIRFVNRSNGSYFYNPFFDTLIPLSAQIALFAHDGKYIKDMIGRTKSRVGIDSGSWTWIPCNCYVGREIPVSFSDIPDGKYSLQVIFFGRFVSSRPTEKSLSEGSWDPNSSAGFASTNELFRSNAISLVVKDGKAAQQTDQPAAGQPATNPADKIPAEVQPLRTTPKDAPR